MLDAEDINKIILNPWRETTGLPTIHQEFIKTRNNHIKKSEFFDEGYSPGRNFWFVVDYDGHEKFCYYLYELIAWDSDLNPALLSPALSFRGDVSCGVRYYLGESKFALHLPEFIEALSFIEQDIRKRWPSVGEFQQRRNSGVNEHV